MTEFNESLTLERGGTAREYALRMQRVHKRYYFESA